MNIRTQFSSNHPIQIYLASTADGFTPITGAHPPILISKDGGPLIGASGTLTELGAGWYSLSGHSFDRDTLGELVITTNTPGIVNVREKVLITQWDPIADITNIINRMGSITGAGNNTLLGYIQALLRSDVQIPTDIGGTYDNSVGSNQALANTITSILLYSETNDLRLTQTRANNLDFLDVDMAAIKARTDLIPNSPSATGSAMSLTQAERDTLSNNILDLANSVESGETLRNALRLFRAILAGKAVENSGTTNFYRKDGVTVASTIIHDSSGDRTSSTDGTL